MESNLPGSFSSVQPDKGIPGVGPDDNGEGNGDLDGGSALLPIHECDSVCFSADAALMLADGLQRKVQDVKLDNRVRVGTDSFSTVFMFTHHIRSIMYTFITIYARHSVSNSAMFVSMTPGHYLYVNIRLTQADRVCQGDLIDAIPSYSKSLIPVRVERATRVRRSSSLYTVACRDYL